MPDYRVIPSIEQLRQRDTVGALERKYGHEAVLEALREQADALREHLGRRLPAGPRDLRRRPCPLRAQLRKSLILEPGRR